MIAPFVTEYRVRSLRSPLRALDTALTTLLGPHHSFGGALMRRFLSNSQVRQLLSAVDLGSPFGQRDYLLIMFLYHTGLRVGECSRLLVTLVFGQSGLPQT
jgi:integrase